MVHWGERARKKVGDESVLWGIDYENRRETVKSSEQEGADKEGREEEAQEGRRLRQGIHDLKNESIDLSARCATVTILCSRLMPEGEKIAEEIERLVGLVVIESGRLHRTLRKVWERDKPL